MSSPDAPAEPKSHAHLMHEMKAVQDTLPPRIKELDDALDILDTPAWTANDFECDSTLQGDDRLHSKLDVCTVELARIVWLGRRPDTGRTFEGYFDAQKFNEPGGELQESAFWVCVAEARREAVVCLRKHQQNHRSYEPLGPPELGTDIVMRNTGQYPHLKTPGAPNQVHVAYSLVTLLYATFNIDVPTPQQTPLWGALPVYAFHSMTQSRPACQCLGTTQDKYALRQYLRKGQFRIEDIGWDDTHPNHRIQWSRRQRMPWPDILRCLVGYVRFAEALVPDADKPAKSVLQEMRDYCTAERERLQHDLEQNTLSTQMTMFQIAHAHLTQKRVQALLSRMHALINT